MSYRHVIATSLVALAVVAAGCEGTSEDTGGPSSVSQKSQAVEEAPGKADETAKRDRPPGWTAQLEYTHKGEKKTDTVEGTIVSEVYRDGRETGEEPRLTLEMTGVGTGDSALASGLYLLVRGVEPDRTAKYRVQTAELDVQQRGYDCISTDEFWLDLETFSPMSGTLSGTLECNTYGEVTLEGEFQD